MPQGSYNVSALLRALGLKNVIEMPVSQTIQPVLPLESMAGQLPVQNGPTGLFGGNVAAVVGENGAIEVVSLDPGGCIILRFESTSVRVYIVHVQQTAFPFLTGPVTHVPQVLSRDTPLTQVFSGNGIDTDSFINPRITGLGSGSNFGPVFLPRGSRMTIVDAGTNVANSWNILILGIAATEGGD